MNHLVLVAWWFQKGATFYYYDDAVFGKYVWARHEGRDELQCRPSACMRMLNVTRTVALNSHSDYSAGGCLRVIALRIEEQGTVLLMLGP